MPEVAANAILRRIWISAAAPPPSQASCRRSLSPSAASPPSRTMFRRRRLLVLHRRCSPPLLCRHLPKPRHYRLLPPVHPRLSTKPIPPPPSMTVAPLPLTGPYWRIRYITFSCLKSPPLLQLMVLSPLGIAPLPWMWVTPLQPRSPPSMELVVHLLQPSSSSDPALKFVATTTMLSNSALSDLPLILKLRQWNLKVLIKFLELMELKACESTVHDSFTLDCCHVVYGYKFLAGLLVFTAVCRMFLCHHLVWLFDYQPLALKNSVGIFFVASQDTHFAEMRFLAAPYRNLQGWWYRLVAFPPLPPIPPSLCFELLSLRTSIGSKPPPLIVVVQTSLHHITRNEWCLLVAFPPTPPVPPDPPDLIIPSNCSIVTWFSDSTVLTLSCLGDMSLMTARSVTASTLSSKQGLILLARWTGWLLTSLGSIVRIFLLRLKLLSPLPLYEDLDILPLYEDLVTLPLYEDLDILSLYEDFVTLPLYEDLVPVYRECLDSSSLLTSFMRFFAPWSSPFDLNGWVLRSVIKSSIYRCSFALVAILEMGNCALAAVLISGVRSSTQDFTLLNNFTVDEIRGLLRDFNLFKCFVVIIPLCFLGYLIVISACYAFMAMFLANTYSFYGD